jgi:hypothetical protein
MNLAVVTIVKDDFPGFQKTVNSLSPQFSKIHHIVIDGSENERQKSLISSICLEIGSSYFQQSPRGIYAAMNLGLSKCEDTELVLFLNAGDFLANSNSISLVLADAESSGSELMIYPCIFGEDAGFIPKIGKVTAKATAKGKSAICHQGVVASAKLIRSAGCFDESYKISADHKLLLIMLQFTSPFVSNQPLSIVSLGGVSDLNCSTLARENARARNETAMSYSLNIADKFYTYRRIIRCRSKILLRRILKVLGIDEDLHQRMIHGKR